jgi:hypothetical protein
LSGENGQGAAAFSGCLKPWSNAESSLKKTGDDVLKK